MSNNFRDDLAWSHQQSDQPFWEEVYRQAFPGFSAMHDVRQDGWAQRGGIDRQVILDDGTVLKIDEKARRDEWPDFAMEVWSSKQDKIPGWMEKPLTCDFIAYAFVPSRTCYLLPYQLLRSAWEKHKRYWWNTYGPKEARNPRYVTVFVPVPIDELLTAIGAAMTVRWGNERIPS